VGWFKVDDQFFERPEVLDVGEDAANLYLRMVAWCSQRRESRVPHTVVRDWTRGDDLDELTRRLVRTRLIRENKRHFVVSMRFVKIGFGCWQLNRKSRIEAASGFATPEQIAWRVAFYGGLCWICRKKPYEAIDHVKPIAAGGSLWPANLRPACKSCNSSKGATWPFERGA